VVLGGIGATLGSSLGYEGRHEQLILSRDLPIKLANHEVLADLTADLI
jgi:hypothetical protein